MITTIAEWKKLNEGLETFNICNLDTLRKYIKGADLQHILNMNIKNTSVVTAEDGNDYEIHKESESKYHIKKISKANESVNDYTEISLEKIKSELTKLSLTMDVCYDDATKLVDRVKTSQYSEKLNRETYIIKSAIGRVISELNGIKTMTIFNKTEETKVANEDGGSSQPEETVTISDYMQSRRYNRELYRRLVEKLKAIVNKYRTSKSMHKADVFPFLRMEISMSAKYQTPYIKIETSNPETDELDPNADRLGGVEGDVMDAIEEVGFRPTDTDEKNDAYYINFDDKD